MSTGTQQQFHECVIVCLRYGTARESGYGIWKTSPRVTRSIGAGGATACFALRAYRYRIPSPMLDFHADKSASQVGDPCAIKYYI
jgi:hypothetical protein